MGSAGRPSRLKFTVASVSQAGFRSQEGDPLCQLPLVPAVPGFSVTVIIVLLFVEEPGLG